MRAPEWSRRVAASVVSGEDGWTYRFVSKDGFPRLAPVEPLYISSPQPAPHGKELREGEHEHEQQRDREQETVLKAFGQIELALARDDLDRPRALTQNRTGVRRERL